MCVHARASVRECVHLRAARRARGPTRTRSLRSLLSPHKAACDVACVRRTMRKTPAVLQDDAQDTGGAERVPVLTFWNSIELCAC